MTRYRFPLRALLSEQFSLIEKLMFTFGIALLLVLSLLVIVNYAVHYANVVKEVWANMDNTAYTTYVRGTTAEPVEEPTTIMERIAKCESGGKQFYSRGILITHVNTDGSIDVGKLMINNKRHEANAAKLGFNIYSEEGNQAYAVYLYEVQGTERMDSFQILLGQITCLKKSLVQNSPRKPIA